MADFFYQMKILIKHINFIGGAVFCFFIISTIILFRLKPNERSSLFLIKICNYSSTIFFGVFVINGIFYLFYPNFLNHIEPTVASLGLALKKGEAVYPIPVSSYPYNGILYGPALFEMQMVFQSMITSILVGSKLPGLIALAISFYVLLTMRKDWIYRGYLLYLFPFGLMLFWNRAEPFLLLLVTITLFLNTRFTENRYLPIIAGILGGSASAFKLHGAAYIFAAYLATLDKNISLKDIIIFSLSSIISFFCFFLPENISFMGFFTYTSLAASRHGLSFFLWLESFVYLMFLILPFFILKGFKKMPVLNITLIAIIEFLITIVASKRGNGFYHLLPLIPINAFFMLDDEKAINSKKNVLAILFACLIVTSFITVIGDLILPMGKSWKKFYEAKREVVIISEKRPDIMMGVTDEDGYPYSFFRVLLKNRQIDYASFMDLQISGIKDDPLIEHLNHCNICCMLIPNKGEAFTLKNYFTLSPLFSDKLRKVFRERFFLIEKGRYYSIYECKRVTK